MRPSDSCKAICGLFGSIRSDPGCAREIDRESAKDSREDSNNYGCRAVNRPLVFISEIPGASSVQINSIERSIVKSDPRAMGDHCALLLGEGGVQVQQERLDVGSEIGDQKRRFVRHEAADEVHVARQPIELVDRDRARLAIAAGFGEGGGELRVALDERPIPCPSRAASA